MSPLLIFSFFPAAKWNVAIGGVCRKLAFGSIRKSVASVAYSGICSVGPRMINASPSACMRAVRPLRCVKLSKSTGRW